MDKFSVRGEWLVDDANSIVYRSLRYWLQYYEAVPMWCDGEPGTKVFCGWHSKRFNCRVAVWGFGGRGITKEDYESGMYNEYVFYVGNADLDVPSIKWAGY